MGRHMSDRHQNKKAYQPQITSFFTSASHDGSALPESSAIHASLAPSIQSSLLSVGMRIRKAVPEGYKTHKASPLGSTSATRLNATSTGPLPQSNSHSENPSSLRQTRSRELQPFCGIHRVGGMAVQDTMLDNMNGYGTTASWADDFEIFASSQESNYSITGEGEAHQPLIVGSNTKRCLDDEEDEDELPDFFFESMESASASRQFAKPRSRRKEAARISAIPATPCMAFADTDFDDAPFLRPMDHYMEEASS